MQISLKDSTRWFVTSIKSNVVNECNNTSHTTIVMLVCGTLHSLEGEAMTHFGRCHLSKIRIEDLSFIYIDEFNHVQSI